MKKKKTLGGGGIWFLERNLRQRTKTVEKKNA